MTRAYLYILIRRAGGFWIGVRLLYLMTGAGSVQMTLGGALIVMTAVTALLLTDAHVVGEDVLVANLGVSRLQTAFPVIVVGALLEAAVVVLFNLRES